MSIHTVTRATTQFYIFRIHNVGNNSSYFYVSLYNFPFPLYIDFPDLRHLCLYCCCYCWCCFCFCCCWVGDGSSTSSGCYFLYYYSFLLVLYYYLLYYTTIYKYIVLKPYILLTIYIRIHSPFNGKAILL